MWIKCVSLIKIAQKSIVTIFIYFLYIFFKFRFWRKFEITVFSNLLYPIIIHYAIIIETPNFHRILVSLFFKCCRIFKISWRLFELLLFLYFRLEYLTDLSKYSIICLSVSLESSNLLLLLLTPVGIINLFYFLI